MRVRLRIAGHLVEVARFGDRIVLHLPASDARAGELEALGMTPRLIRTLAPVLKRGGGLVLVAGPAQSGRTTTLRALLGQLDDGTRNLLAVESAGQFREALRQDADAILIDTITDRETAALAAQAVEAGHLVLAGIDAPDSVGAIRQMRALRVEPFQLASTLRAVLAQRLVKRLCRDCRRPVQAQGSVSALLGFDPGTVVYAPVGCERCDGGFAGRIAVFEAIHADAPLRRLVNDGCDGAIIARHAFLNAPNLGSAARALVREGVTTPEEAVRVSRG
ncbi:MAG: ATPase, T2SS/T4P/T4SS family [Pseudomonadota bacterium]